jgi:hypothetical protein
MSKLCLLVAGLLVLALPGTVQADTITFTFSGNSVHANSTLTGGPATLTGINSLTGSLGTVTFTSGPWTDDDGTGWYGYLPGGSITIQGGQTLFAGTFSGPGEWSLILYNSATGTAYVQYTGQVAGNVNPALLALLGLPTDHPYLPGTITLILQFNQNSGGNGTLVSGNLQLTTTPEPGTMALFGSGLVGIAGMIRRRRKAAVTATRAVV